MKFQLKVNIPFASFTNTNKKYIQVKRYFSDDEEMFEDDEVKCLRVVRSVLDEETVLEMVITFLQMTHDNSIPQTASIVFSSCYFDKESGFIIQFIYMLVMKE